MLLIPALHRGVLWVMDRRDLIRGRNDMLVWTVLSNIAEKIRRVPSLS